MGIISASFLSTVMNIAEQMLISGGEVHKVEDSVKRIFKAYGAERTDVFIITSSIVVTIHSADNEVLTQTRRISSTSSDYEKLHKLNNLSRTICQSKMSEEEIALRLQEISNGKKYSLFLEFVCYAVIAAAFTLFFGGGFIEAGVSLFIGASVRFVIFICDKSVSNKIFPKFVSSLTSSAIAYFALKLGIVNTVDNIIIGNIMALIPGIGLTTALKDLFMGDSIAGLLRTLEACLTALSIAAGYFVIVILTGGI